MYCSLAVCDGVPVCDVGVPGIHGGNNNHKYLSVLQNLGIAQCLGLLPYLALVAACSPLISSQHKTYVRIPPHLLEQVQLMQSTVD